MNTTNKQIYSFFTHPVKDEECKKWFDYTPEVAEKLAKEKDEKEVVPELR